MEKSNSNIIIEQNRIPIISFCTGTMLLISFAVTKYEPLLFVGLFYVALALLINTSYLFCLILNLIKYPNNQYETLIRIGIALSNIPITILYTYIVFNHLL